MATKKAAKKAAKKDAPATLERKIFFYRIDAGTGPDGRPRPVDYRALTSTLESVDKLAYEANARYMAHADGHIYVEAHRIEWPMRFQFTLTRTTNLPQEEHKGRTKPLAIPKDAGLAETSHIVAFRDGILGAEYNFYGPRVGSLRDYLAGRAAESFPNVAFKQLLRRDVLDELRKIEVLQTLKLRIRAPFIETIGGLDRDLFDALSAVRDVSDAWDVELILRSTKKIPLRDRLMNAIRMLARIDHLHEQVKTLKVNGPDTTTGFRKEVDVLKDDLIFVEDIVRVNERTRALDSESAYSTIERVFGDNRDRILGAATIAEL